MTPAHTVVSAPKVLMLALLFAVLEFGRVSFIRDGIWDDNCWLLSAYASDNLWQFLNTGFVEARRVPFGAFLYGLFGLHRDTEFFYPAWHALTLATLAIPPFLLYLLLRELFPAKQGLALLSALAFVVFPLDYTSPYASGINYRLGLLFGLASLYLTVISVSPQRCRPVGLVAALFSAAVSYYVFMEAAVALEPARLYLIAWRRHDPAVSRQTWARRTLTVAAWFALVAAPLVIYKLAFKTYGIYAGIYGFDPAFLLRFWDIAKAAGHFAFSHWIILARHPDIATGATYAAGALGTLAAFVLLRRGLATGALKEPAETHRRREPWHFLALTLLLALPPVLLFHAFSRPISWGMNSTHAVLSQAGYAMLLGIALHAGLRRGGRRPWVVALLSLWVGAGVFFANLNTDQYRESWTQQSRFWRAFMDRFPALPERAAFFFDVQDGALYSDLVIYYDFELQFNLLYADSRDPSRFRRYPVYTMEELKLSGTNPSSGMTPIVRTTHLGQETLDPRQFVVVRYRDGRLLVNGEIVHEIPDISYRSWADKPAPVLPQRIADYPLREKLEFTR